MRAFLFSGEDFRATERRHNFLYDPSPIWPKKSAIGYLEAYYNNYDEETCMAAGVMFHTPFIEKMSHKYSCNLAG